MNVNSLPTPASIGHLSRPQVQVRLLESGLQRRVTTLAKDRSSGSSLMIVLADGEATLSAGDKETTLAGPAIFWRGKAPAQQLSIAAGASCSVAEISGEAMSRAIGDFFESRLLQSLFDGNWERSFDADEETLADIDENLGAIAAETQSQQTGGAMIVIARLRIILVRLLRVSSAGDNAHVASGENRHHLQRFRQLLEVGFRSHRSVADYAADLGITSDRLHAICTRELGRSPKALVDQRVAREASIGLERSTLSIKQLSYALGFRDPAHFTHFFGRMSGMSPSRFRRMLDRSAPGGSSVPYPSFADWP